MSRTRPRPMTEDEEEAAIQMTLEEFGIEFEIDMDTDSLSRAFFECAAEGNVETLQFILSNDENGELLNSVDVDGFSALMIAAAEGNREVVLELLRRNADANLRTFELKSAALHFAAKNGDPIIVEEMCKKTKQIDFWNINADTPLVWACIEGRDEAVAILLRHGADTRVTNHYGATTLMCATMIGEDTDEESDMARRNIVKMLLEKCPELVNVQDRDGSTAMHLAASCGYLQCCHALLEGGADITIRNIVGQTPLEEAEQTGCDGSEPCVDFLKSRWAQLEEEVNARMRTMLEMEGIDISISQTTSKSKKKKKQKKSKKKNKTTSKAPQQPTSASHEEEDYISSDDKEDEEPSIPMQESSSQILEAEQLPEDVDTKMWTTVTSRKRHESMSKQIVEKQPPQVSNPNIDEETPSEVAMLPSRKESIEELQRSSPLKSSPQISAQRTPPQQLKTPPQVTFPPTPMYSSSIPFLQLRPTNRVTNEQRRTISYRRGTPAIKPAKLGWLQNLDENVRDALSMLACGQCGDWINDNLQCTQCHQLYCARCVPTLCCRCGIHLNPLELKHDGLAQQQAACIGLVKFNEEPAASLDSLEHKMYEVCPLAEQLAVSPVGMIPGQDTHLAQCSMGQLDVLEEMHYRGLRDIQAARIAYVRTQERTRFEQEFKQHLYLQSLPYD